MRLLRKTKMKTPSEFTVNSIDDFFAQKALCSNVIFYDAEKAREWLEGLLWPDGPVCPHCKFIGCSYKLEGKSHRAGLYKCKNCENQYTITVKTMFDRSHIPLNIWLSTFFIMLNSNKGISARKLGIMFNMTYKTAWLMCRKVSNEMMKKYGTHELRDILVDNLKLKPSLPLKPNLPFAMS